MENLGILIAVVSLATGALEIIKVLIKRLIDSDKKDPASSISPAQRELEQLRHLEVKKDVEDLYALLEDLVEKVNETIHRYSQIEKVIVKIELLDRVALELESLKDLKEQHRLLQEEIKKAASIPYYCPFGKYEIKQ